MPIPLSGTSCCTLECSPVIGVGPTGAPGQDGIGTNGTDGVSAFTVTSANFTQPATSATVTVTVAENSWAVLGENVYIEGGGYYEITGLGGSTLITVENLDASGNVVAGTVVGAGAQVTPSGYVGPAGPVFSTAASEIVSGIAELATVAETNTGTDDLRIVTPLKLKTNLDTLLDTTTASYAAASSVSITPPVNCKVYTVYAALADNSGTPYVGNALLKSVNVSDGCLILFNISIADSADPTFRVYDETTAGTLIFEFTGDSVSALEIEALFVFRSSSGEWDLLGATIIE